MGLYDSSPYAISIISCFQRICHGDFSDITLWIYLIQQKYVYDVKKIYLGLFDTGQKNLLFCVILIFSTGFL